jgi:hypothetical protein
MGRPEPRIERGGGNAASLASRARRSSRDRLLVPLATSEQLAAENDRSLSSEIRGGLREYLANLHREAA